MREIFYELINEAKDARVVIDGDEWPIGFNTNIKGRYMGNERNLSTLVINNEEEFFRYLEIYINKELKLNRKHLSFVDDKDKAHTKSIMTYLFANMSTEDFLNPVACLRKRIGFLEDTTFSLFDELFAFNAIPGAKLRVKQEMQSIYMETPYIIDMSICFNGQETKLPYISYGICEEDGKKVCYIYSIMNHKVNNKSLEENQELTKKVHRLLYKLNKGVYENESQEYKDYKEGKSDYYPENISDVTPSFVFAAVTFLTILQSKGIETIKVVPYLPIRYLSRGIAASNANSEEVRKQREERNKQIQTNATDKFIRTFRRAAYHMKGLEIVSYPYELDECLNMELHDRKINNKLLQDVSENIMGR